jgi:hypothetical protein
MKADFIKDKYKTTGVSLEMSVAEELIILTSLQDRLLKKQDSLKFYTEETHYFNNDKEWLDNHNFNREEQIFGLEKDIAKLKSMLLELQS